MIHQLQNHANIDFYFWHTSMTQMYIKSQLLTRWLNIHISSIISKIKYVSMNTCYSNSLLFINTRVTSTCHCVLIYLTLERMNVHNLHRKWLQHTHPDSSDRLHGIIIFTAVATASWSSCEGNTKGSLQLLHWVGSNSSVLPQLLHLAVGTALLRYKRPLYSIRGIWMCTYMLA